MDVKNAFLNSKFQEEVYVKLPSGLISPPHFSHKGCHLQRAIYGLKQSPRAWFSKFSSKISQLAFSSNFYDLALFLCQLDCGITFLLIYIDDMIITSDDVQSIQDLKEFLGHQFEMKDLALLCYFLGLKVSSLSNGYYLTQAKYASNLISRVGITDNKTVDRSIDYNSHLTSSGGKFLLDATRYRQLVGGLVYLTVTCPEISYAVYIVNQFMAGPQSSNYAVVLKILRYLKGTMF